MSGSEECTSELHQWFLLCRFIATLQDPGKQLQYSDVLKTLQEEHRLLQDMEAALEEIKNAPSTSGRSSVVSSPNASAPGAVLIGSSTDCRHGT